MAEVHSHAREAKEETGGRPPGFFKKCGTCCESVNSFDLPKAVSQDVPQLWPQPTEQSKEMRTISVEAPSCAAGDPGRDRRAEGLQAFVLQ